MITFEDIVSGKFDRFLKLYGNEDYINIVQEPAGGAQQQEQGSSGASQQQHPSSATSTNPTSIVNSIVAGGIGFRWGKFPHNVVTS